MSDGQSAQPRSASSLIERLRAYADEQRARARFIADENRGEWWAGVATARREVANDLDALLSQPTPTAEPMRAAQSDGGDRLIEFAEEMLGVPLEPWQMRLCRRVFGGNVGRSTGRPDAAPPSIPDMMPRTTFWARTKWGHEWPFVAEGGNAIRANVSGYPDGILLHEFDIDPATIRDVTPPKGHP